MHELSICQGIVKGILSELDAMEPRPKRLISARIVVGELRQIVPELMDSAYSAVTKDTPIEGSRLEIKTCPLNGECKDCGWSGGLETDDFRCAECGSSGIEISGGMELYLDNLEVEKEQE